MIDKNKVISYIEDLNKTEVIKIHDSDKTRRIFKQSDEVFKIFGSEDKGVLNPFNDYTYEWLNSFLYSVCDFIGYDNFDDFDELSEHISEVLNEWVDSEVSVYTSDLTEWLHNNNSNVYYLTEVGEEYEETDGFKLLAQAQYKAIEEVYNNALNCLIEDLKAEFDD